MTEKRVFYWLPVAGETRFKDEDDFKTSISHKCIGGDLKKQLLCRPGLAMGL